MNYLPNNTPIAVITLFMLVTLIVFFDYTHSSKDMLNAYEGAEDFG
jgi:hypothetical protein